MLTILSLARLSHCCANEDGKSQGNSLHLLEAWPGCHLGCGLDKRSKERWAKMAGNGELSLVRCPPILICFILRALQQPPPVPKGPFNGKKGDTQEPAKTLWRECWNCRIINHEYCTLD